MENPKDRPATEPPDELGAAVFDLGAVRAARIFPIKGNDASAPREEPVTEAEVAEYRRIRPRLLRMLAEWELVSANCPMAVRLIDRD